MAGDGAEDDVAGLGLAVGHAEHPGHLSDPPVEGEAVGVHVVLGHASPPIYQTARIRREPTLDRLSPLIADLLRDRGHDAQAIKGDRPDVEGASDAEVLAVAHREARAVVTTTVKDFRPLAADRIAAGRGHSGLILVPATVPRTRAAGPRLATEVAAIADASPSGLAGQERWVRP